jgi:hypothetical protein
MPARPVHPTDSKGTPHQPKGIDTAEPIAIEDQGAAAAVARAERPCSRSRAHKKSRSQDAGGKV